MWHLYSSLVHEHDQHFVLLAIAICALGTFAVALLVHRAAAATAVQRLRWVAFAGAVTGIAIWTTHFAAMLGFAPELDLHFDVPTALLSVLVCILLSIAGWQLAVGSGTGRRLLGGALVGIGLAIAHFLDMAAVRFGGTVQYDPALVTTSVVGGVALCAAGAWLLLLSPRSRVIVGAATTLTAAVLFLHFVAMAAVTLVRDGSPVDNTGLLDLNGLGTMVVAACVMMIASALVVALHSLRVAAATAQEHERLLQALDALRKSEEHHRAYVELDPQIPWLAAPDGSVLELGPLWTALSGRPVEEGLGWGWASFIHPDDLPAVEKVWRTALTTGRAEVADARYRLRLQDGSYRWFRARAQPRLDRAGQVIAWYGSLEDIDDQVTAELALRESEERYRLAARATHDVIWDWIIDPDHIIWTGAVRHVLGEDTPRETSSDWWLARVHPQDQTRVEGGLQEALQGSGEYWQAEYRFLNPQGDYIFIFEHGFIVRDAGGRAVRMVGSMLDVTDRKKFEEELRQAAYRDPLTRLPNRLAFVERLDAAVANARANTQCVGLIVANLKSFKSVNDRLGHSGGNALLRQVAERLTHAAPPGAMLARLGGDEFAIVLSGLSKSELDASRIQSALADLKAPYLVEDLRIDVSFSAGAAFWPRDAETADELQRSAALALHAAKAELPGTVFLFRPELRKKSEETRRMLDAARAALRDDRIVPFYQPKICLKTGQIAGFEALLRWHDHRHGLQPPSGLGAAFEDVELAVQITDRMLDAVIRDAATWRSIGAAFGRIAVNVSTADFRRQDLTDRILSRLQTHGLPTDGLEVEVTESVFLGQNAAVVAGELERLSAAGVTVALDDFGTGYASLTHLQQFAVGVLKIDKGFVADIGTQRAGIIDALLHMAQSLGIVVVAEGIEQPEQAKYLRGKGCDLGQGFLFSRPLPGLRVPAVLASWSPEAGGLPEVSNL
jgi:diguanylate cyclase (GGDEF)-like protein/PAS domain S-box-containing protein